MSGAGLEMLSGPVRRGFVAFEFAAHILFGMPDPTKDTPQKSTGSFANFLASFAGRLQSDLWDDSALMDDVATLSYEQALRTTRRSGTPEIRDDSAFKYEDHASAKSLVNPSASASRSKKQRSASIAIASLREPLSPGCAKTQLRRCTTGDKRRRSAPLRARAVAVGPALRP